MLLSPTENTSAEISITCLTFNSVTLWYHTTLPCQTHYLWLVWHVRTYLAQLSAVISGAGSGMWELTNQSRLGIQEGEP